MLCAEILQLYFEKENTRNAHKRSRSKVRVASSVRVTNVILFIVTYQILKRILSHYIHRNKNTEVNGLSPFPFVSYLLEEYARPRFIRCVSFYISFTKVAFLRDYFPALYTELLFSRGFSVISRVIYSSCVFTSNFTL